MYSFLGGRDRLDLELSKLNKHSFGSYLFGAMNQPAACRGTWSIYAVDCYLNDNIGGINSVTRPGPVAEAAATLVSKSF